MTSLGRGWIAVAGGLALLLAAGAGLASADETEAPAGAACVNEAGDASCTGVAVSGEGRAEGAAAVSGTGGASGLVAVSGTGYSSGVVAASGLGDASGGGAAASVTGNASNGLLVASVWGDVDCSQTFLRLGPYVVRVGCLEATVFGQRETGVRVCGAPSETPVGDDTLCLDQPELP